MHRAVAVLLVACVVFICIAQTGVQNSDRLQVIQLTKHTYQHITYLETEQFGKVPCNGLIVAAGDEAVIFDTPANTEDALELIDWVRSALEARIIAVIPTHFHVDCLGSLGAFHEQGIPSFAHSKTIDLAREQESELPQNGFDGAMELSVGGRQIVIQFPGEGHTRDNVVAYFPDDQVLFGGCLLKSSGSGKGNLEDANVEAWPGTVEAVRLQFPEVRYVVPGHGKAGGPELLDDTIQLFRK